MFRQLGREASVRDVDKIIAQLILKQRSVLES
jgi:hypothetical protein